MFQSRQLEKVQKKTKFRGQREIDEVLKRRGGRELQKQREKDADWKQWRDAHWEGDNE